MTFPTDSLVFLAVNAFVTYLIHLFLRLFFRDGFAGKKAAIFLFALYYAITSAVYLFFPSILLNMTSSLLATFLLTFAYRARLSKRIVVTVLNYATINACEMVVGAAAGLGGVDLFARTHYGDSFCLLAVAVLEFFVIRLIGRFRGIGSDAPLPKSYSVLAVLVPCLSVLFEAVLFTQETVDDFVYALSLLCLVSLNFLVLSLYDSIAKRFREQAEADAARQQAAYYQKQAQLIQQNARELTRFRHDIKNHTIALRELIRTGQTEKATQYIDSFSGLLEPAESDCSTGIVPVDSIVNYKFARAKEAGISVHAEIAVPNPLQIDANDLTAILGNLLDNAVEAAAKAETKSVKLKISYDKGTLLLALSNSYNGDLPRGRATTKPDDKTPHGVGLRSVKAAVDKYNGELKITHTDTEFSVKILLFLPAESTEPRNDNTPAATV